MTARFIGLPTGVDPTVIEELRRVAADVALAAHAPYSGFRVGAAVLMDGSIFAGCNVENASYGLTICAERAAIFTGVANGRRQLDAIGIVCLDVPENARPGQRMPCGACRQVISEFAHSGTRIFIEGVGEFSCSELLPEPFRI